MFSSPNKSYFSSKNFANKILGTKHPLTSSNNGTTTGIRQFAKCPKHSANKYLAKSYYN